MVRPAGQCDVVALAQARRELKVAIRRAAAEHEQKQENLLVLLKLRYVAATASAAGEAEPSAAAEVPLATAAAVGVPPATVAAVGTPLATVTATGQLSPADDKPDAPGDTSDTKLDGAAAATEAATLRQGLEKRRHEGV
eukprot:COSAG01_NODE_510_length_16076_cov_102.088252_18_plen_139_part_00